MIRERPVGAVPLFRIDRTWLAATCKSLNRPGWISHRALIPRIGLCAMDQFAEMREAAFFSGSDFAESGCPQGDLIPTVAMLEHWPKSRTPCATPYADLRLP